MAVYVDDSSDLMKLRGVALGFYCRLTADTGAELDVFAKRLNLRAADERDCSVVGPHYLVSRYKRRMAVELGAVEIPSPLVAETDDQLRWRITRVQLELQELKRRLIAREQERGSRGGDQNF